MPLLDHSQFRPELWEDCKLDTINQVFDELAALRITEVDCSPLGTAPRLATTAKVLVQTNIYRAVEQAEGAVLLCHARKWVSAMTIARGLLETVAFNEHFAAKLSDVISKGDFKELQNLVQNFTFATRLEKFIQIDDTRGIEAKSILTPIDKLDKRIEGVRSNYDFLCEIAHPNSFGTFNFYANEQQGKFIMSEDGFSVDVMHHVLSTIPIAGLMLYSYKALLALAEKIDEIEENSV